MKSNLGRENLWDNAIWAEIDKAVLQEVGRVRIAQKVFPSIAMSNDSGAPMANVVPDDVFNPATNTIQEGQTKAFLEISVDFPLTLGQLENEHYLRTGRTLARLVARQAALAEDLVLFQGQGAPLPPTVKVANLASAGQGLIGAARTGPNAELHVPVLPGRTAQDPIWGANTFTQVVSGIANLTARGQPAPYALILETQPFADVHVAVPNTLVTTADRLLPLLAGGLYSTGALPTRTGLLASLPGDATRIHLSQDATTAYLQEDQQGNHIFRVFQRVQFVVSDATSLVALAFDAPAVPAAAVAAPSPPGWGPTASKT